MAKKAKSSPSPKQVLGAKIRAEQEAFELKHRKPYKGGWEVPSSKERLVHLAKVFNMPAVEISYFLTYSRHCTHPWSDGACLACPQ